MLTGLKGFGRNTGINLNNRQRCRFDSGRVDYCGRSSKPAQAASTARRQVVESSKGRSVYSEWIGTTDGMVNADIKAQVTGYLLRQNYQEGSFVGKGSCCLRSIPGRFRH